MWPAMQPPRWYREPIPFWLPCEILWDKDPGEMIVALHVGGQRVEAIVSSKAVRRDDGAGAQIRVIALGEFEEEGETFVLVDIPGESPTAGSRLKALKREVSDLLPAT